MISPSSRKRLQRALLSALAGGGLTAAAFSPLTSAALAGEATVTTTTPSEPTTTEEAKTPPPATTTSPATTTTPPATSGETTITTTTSSTTPTAQTPPPAKPSAKSPKGPEVVLQRRQKNSAAKPTSPSTSATQPNGNTPNGPNGAANNNVAAAPQVIAAQTGALAAELAGSAASTQALAFYRIPLFLLPIYQAASVQYGVPWQILAAINEVETNYGTDLSVSSAGAVGWMQFMPSTWIQYGVDALNAGYADPYNPVDAIFAAARYLHAAGAARDLHGAILAYNHSDEYVKSVLLRAKLISSYPKSVIATLTGLSDGRLPITGKQLTWGSITQLAPAGTATGRASAAAKSAKLSAPTTASPSAAPAPGTAAGAAAKAKKPQPLQLVNLMSAANANVVAVQDGRVMQLGRSQRLGNYVILRDIYGDVFTYSGLGSIASHYQKPKAPHVTTTPGSVSAVTAAKPAEPKPKLAASEGRQPPVTLKVSSHLPRTVPSQHATVSSASEEATSPQTPASGKVRLFAHPGNPDAVAAAAARKRSRSSATRLLPLRVGAIVSKGTVLGTVDTPPAAQAGHLRFAIRPGGDASTIDPRAVLQNWAQLDAALHPQGASTTTDLLGATSSGVFLLSKEQLERTVLSDPGITIYPCGRQDIASGAIDKRVLAVLAFLSRSGLKPTVSALRCGHSETTVSGFVSEHFSGDAVDISAIDGIPIAGHQGAGSITDVTIRALLTLQGEFVPHQIISLMQYPGASNTLAMPEHWDHIHIGFRPEPGSAPTTATTPAQAGRQAAHSAASGPTAPAPTLVDESLDSTQWSQLVSHIAALPVPSVKTKPSSAAIKDPSKP